MEVSKTIFKFEYEDFIKIPFARFSFDDECASSKRGFINQI